MNKREKCGTGAGVAGLDYGVSEVAPEIAEILCYGTAARGTRKA